MSQTYIQPNCRCRRSIIPGEDVRRRLPLEDVMRYNYLVLEGLWILLGDVAVR